MSTIVAQICIRRDTAANFTSANPTLALGEIAYETDTRNIKVGDGATAWTALPYINPYRGGNAAAPTSNTVLGSGAGANITSVENTCIGYLAGQQLVSGIYNVAVGAYARPNASGGNNNTVVGMYAGLSQGGSDNTLIGSAACYASSTASNITAVGREAAAINTASDITAVGARALDANTTGASNTAVGKDALGANTTGGQNTAVGLNALDALTTGGNNAAFGFDALGANTNGARNSVFGSDAGGAITSGSDNSILGAAALYGANGSSNVAIGYNAGRYNNAGVALTGANTSIFIGRDSRANADSQTNQIVIGDQALGNGSNTTTIGNSSTTGTFIPAGNLTLTNGNFIVGTSGKGIDFSATSEGSGTMTSELLSDYEEGTWTPDLQFGGASTGITYESRNGTYTKIGRAVVARCYLKMTSKGTATGAATIAGLPFTSAGSSSHSAGAFSSAYITLANYQIAVVNLAGTTTIELNELVSGALPSALTDAAFQNSSIVTVTITYFV